MNAMYVCVCLVCMYVCNVMYACYAMYVCYDMNEKTMCVLCYVHILCYGSRHVGYVCESALLYVSVCVKCSVCMYVWVWYVMYVCMSGVCVVCVCMLSVHVRVYVMLCYVFALIASVCFVCVYVCYVCRLCCVYMCFMYVCMLCM